MLQTDSLGRYSMLHLCINESPSNSSVKNEKGELEGEVQTLLTFSPPHKNCFAKWV